MLFGDPDQKRILSTGRKAMAKIVSLDESGMGYVTVNDQPYAKLTLEVHDGSKAPYQTTLSTIIPRLQVPQFQPGTMLNILIDPNDPLKVVFDTTGTAEAMPSVGNTEQPDIVDGKKAMAEVLELRKTDKMKNGNTVYVAKLEITGEGIAKYAFDKEIPLPQFALAYFTVGRKYDCTVDRNDKTKVMMNIMFK